MGRRGRYVLDTVIHMRQLRAGAITSALYFYIIEGGPL